MVDAPGGVDRSTHCRASGERRIKDVFDAVVFIDDVDDPRAAQRARVVLLAAGRGIERGAVEVDGAAAVSDVEDLSVKLEEFGVSVVEALSQGDGRGKNSIQSAVAS